MANIFEKLQDAQFQAQITPRTKESTEWMRKKIQKMSRLDGSTVIASPELRTTNTIELGSMVMFNYKADKGTVIRKKDNLFNGLVRNVELYKRMSMSVKNILHPGFYDAFPVVIITDIYEGYTAGSKYLQGINLHYLAPLDRARLLDEILEKTNGDNFDPIHLYTTIATMSKGNKIYNHPAFKIYNFENIKSRIVQITEDEWEIAAFLPTTEFRTDYITGPYGLRDAPPTKQQVYQWSKRKL